jgi:hypothetical protein
MEVFFQVLMGVLCAWMVAVGVFCIGRLFLVFYRLIHREDKQQ